MNYLDLFDSAACELSERSPPRFADLEARIRAMAARWRFLPGELEAFLAAARADPATWLRAVALDERREAEFRAGGLLPPRADA